MGFMDTIKGMLGKSPEKVDSAIDKAADVADDKTGGKYSEHIDTGTEKAKDVVKGITGDDNPESTT